MLGSELFTGLASLQTLMQCLLPLVEINVGIVVHYLLIDEVELSGLLF